MAQYTIELGALIESGFDIWDSRFKFPIFDEEYRKPLQNFIETYYYDNEIGFETAELFRNNLNRSLCAIMPYYNQLFKAATLDLGEDVLTSRGEKANDTHNIKRDGTEEFTTQRATTSGKTRTDDLQTALEHGMKQDSTGSTDVSKSETTTDNLQEHLEYSSHGSTENTSTHDGNNKEYDIPVSGSDAGFDPKFMTGGSTDGANDSNHGETTTSDDSSKTNTGTRKIEGTDGTTEQGTVTTSGTDTTKNTGTQKEEGTGSESGTDNKENHETTVDEYIHNLTAYDAPKFELLARLRETFINIDRMICDDDAVWNCFMHIL